MALIETSGETSRTKRPDLSIYVELASADLGLAAEIVVESKKPNELQGFLTLLAALVDYKLWNDKLKPYVQAYAERVRYFILTTFEHMPVVPISDKLHR